MATITTMPKGLKVSIKFTPQAQDDYLHMSENSSILETSTSDLLANDSAVNAARVGGIFGLPETQVQSQIGTLVSNTAPNGSVTAANPIIVGGAIVTYDATSGDITIDIDPANFQYLAEGETANLGSFTYVIRMSNGAFSTAVAHIVIDGSNDLPDIRVETGDLAAVTIDETDSALATSGTLTVTDVDTYDTVTAEVTGVEGAGKAGGLLPADLLSMRSLAPLSLLTRIPAKFITSRGVSILEARRSTICRPARH